MGEWIKRLIPKNIAGILGIVQVVIPLVREILVVATRIVALIPGTKDDKMVAGVVKVFDTIENWFIEVKNLFL